MEYNRELQWSELSYRGLFELQISDESVKANHLEMPTTVNRNVTGKLDSFERGQHPTKETQVPVEALSKTACLPNIQGSGLKPQATKMIVKSSGTLNQPRNLNSVFNNISSVVNSRNSTWIYSWVHDYKIYVYVYIYLLSWQLASKFLHSS